MNWKKRALELLAAAGIGFVALVAVFLIWITQPEPEREGAVKRTPMLVQTVVAEQGTYRPTLVATGAVRAVQDITLQPQVSGQIQRVADDFVPGQVVAKGDPLVWIDGADASNNLAQARARLLQAESELALELGRQEVARTERAQVDYALTEEQESLITRKPQLSAAKATVKAARASAQRAEVEVARTRVKAPFDALILERNAHTGSVVGPGTNLGRLVDIDRYWVELTLPSARLQHLTAGESHVEIIDQGAWKPGEFRDGTLHSIVRAVDDRTRMARLLVEVPDPLALNRAKGGPPLMAGAWVEARLQAQPLRDVIRLDRTLLRKNNTVWEFEDDVLQVREVDVILEDSEFVYIRSGLEPGALVVSTDLSTVRSGSPLRTSEKP